MTLSVTGDNIQFPDLSVQDTAATGFGFKNRIINGAMMVNQRGTVDAQTTITTGNEYTVDRFQGVASVSSKFSLGQSSTAVGGFINSLKALSLSAYTVGAAENFFIRQQIEGLNVADLGWGAAGAATVTLSFKVRSSLTGTFGGSLFNYNGTRSYPFSYTISAANTDTTISVTIPGDTSGTWLTTNGSGITVTFGLGVGATLSGTAGAWAGAYYTSATGATSVVGTSGATFYITGVQLEKGSTATSFDYRDYGRELAMCQRYYFQTGGVFSGQRFGMGWWYNSTIALGVNIPMPAPLRDPASVSVSYSSLSDFAVYNGGIGITPTVISVDGAGGQGIVPLSVTTAGTATAGYAAAILALNSNARLKFSNEL